MAGFKGSYSHTPGDQFYFKGGVTCPNSYFPLTVADGGASGNVDYYGPDANQSWYAGSAWSRPIMSGGGAVISGNNVMFIASGHNYITFDNFEITGMKDSNDGGAYDHDTGFLMMGDYQTVEHMYFHGWVTTGTNDDNLEWIAGCNGSCGAQSHNLIDSNYCNGADATPPSTSDGNGSSECIRYIGGTISNNVIRNVANGYVGAGSDYGNVIHDNDFGPIYTSYGQGVHSNALELNGSGPSGNVIYNNKIHDTTSTGVWPFVISPSTNVTEWVFNNICWNVTKDCYDIDTQGNFPGYTVNFYNNTGVQATSGYYCIATTDRGSSNTIGAANIVNNHCITPTGTTAAALCFNNGSACSTVTNLTETKNVVMSVATAASQGYTSAEAFVYSPTAASNSTVGAGTNLTSSCSGSTAALCSETAYSCYVGGGNALVCPVRTPLTRAASGTCSLGVPGCWDAGAHLLAAGNSAPNPPTGLQANIQ
jgi:hypothetical protein